MFHPDIIKKGIRLAVMALMLALCTQAVGTHSTLVYAEGTPELVGPAPELVGPPKPDPCDKDGAAFKALEKAVQSRLATRIGAHDDAYMKGTDAARNNMGLIGNVFGPSYARLCFDMFNQFNGLVEMLLGIAGTILNMLISFINQLLSLACQYVVAAITNLLTSICIPLPDLPSMPGFGGPDRKSCNGLSMADLASVNMHPVQVPYISRATLDSQLTGYANTFGTMITRSTGGSSSNSTRQ